MKKLISIFGALTFTATTTIMVVSCANLDNYYEIKNLLDKNESMIILISAEDCEHCKKLTYEMEKYNETASGVKTYSSFEDMMNKMTTTNYNNLLGSTINEDEQKLTRFGDKVEKVTFKEYKAEHYENLFDEEWLVSLKDLIRDQLREIYIQNDDNSEKLTTEQMNKKINTNYLNGIMTGTPTFLHFRNGRFLGTTSWNYESLNIDNGEFATSIETYVNNSLFGSATAKTKELWGDSNLSDTLYKKISETSTTGEGESETN